MSKEQQLKDMHQNFKRNFPLNEYSAPKEVDEWESNFRIQINSNKTDLTLEDMLIYFRGIVGVTIVRSSRTTNRNSAGLFSSDIYIKYIPQAFNRGVGMDEMFDFIKKEMRKLEGVSLIPLTKSPGTPVVSGDK
jgi:hypothetical protein